MMDNTKGLDVTSNRLEDSAQELASTSIVAGPVYTISPNRCLAARLHRSRKGFASGKSRLSLKIDADCMTAGKGTPVTGESIPASISSCGSGTVPWWEVEYQCPPPGHLGAHTVPVSSKVETAGSPAATNSVARTSSMPSSTETNRTHYVSIELSTRAQIEMVSSANIIRPGLVLYETPDRARRGSHSKLLSTRASAPCLLVDSSPIQKRKMRSQDLTDCETDLFYTPVTKELKRAQPGGDAVSIGAAHKTNRHWTDMRPFAVSKLIEKTEDDEYPAP
ncbi:unnamed protein product [Peronospora destructor]|uniref:Uncharacterized protein n=1 Tax=Peronospora destructor TaxID=86335 RepID=A0AAV0TGP6_9STRA|nr:unnamed protein product [Peronospora destructor]